MLNNRLNVTFDYFQRKSKNMVGPAPELPNLLGIAVPKVNNLDMTKQYINANLEAALKYNRSLSMELPYLCQTIKWLLINTPIRQTQF